MGKRRLSGKDYFLVGLNEPHIYLNFQLHLQHKPIRRLNQKDILRFFIIENIIS